MGMYIRETGPADAATLVLLPGGGTGGWFWQPQIERLAGEFHLLVPDLPEQGRSMAEKPFTIVDAARRVADLIRARGHGGRAHVGGISLGAQTVVQLIATNPELVQSAIISSANVRGLPGAFLIRPYLRLAMPLAAAPWLVRLGMKSSGIPDRFYEDVLAEARTATLDSLTHVTLESIRFRIPAGLKPPAPQTAAVRTLVLAGQKEYRLMRDAARDLAAAIPHAEGRLVQNGIHAWNMQYPDLCAETIRAWIRGQPLPAELLPLAR